MNRTLVSMITIAMIISIQSTAMLGVASATAVAHGVTPNAHTHAVTTKLRKRNPSRANPGLIPTNNQQEIVVDDDVVLGRNHNRIEIVKEDEEELSDYVKFRLLLARVKALQKYEEIWG